MITEHFLNSRQYNYYTGLSTDSKPTYSIPGSIFVEIDTGDEYRFDGSGTWHLIQNVTRSRNLVWNPSTLKYEAMTQTSVTVGELTVSGVAVSNLPENYDPSNYAVRLAEDGTTLYVGEAPIGSATSSAVWRVKKVDTSSGVAITWAGGGAFNQIWNNYATLTYT